MQRPSLLLSKGSESGLIQRKPVLNMSSITPMTNISSINNLPHTTTAASVRNVQNFRRQVDFAFQQRNRSRELKSPPQAENPSMHLKQPVKPSDLGASASRASESSLTAIVSARSASSSAKNAPG